MFQATGREDYGSSLSSCWIEPFLTTGGTIPQLRLLSCRGLWTRDCTILLSQQGGSRDCPSQEVWRPRHSDSPLVMSRAPGRDVLVAGGPCA